jgi:hypothetical protein
MQQYVHETAFLLKPGSNGRLALAITRKLSHHSGDSMTISNQYLGGMSNGTAQADDRGQHQHALLNLANFYYTTGGLDSAKAVSVRQCHGF